MRRGRRDLLSAAAGAATVSLAGCLSEPDRRRPDSGAVYTSLFTLQEFTSAVVADRPVENAVPIGEHGHGWEPPTSLLPEIVDAAAFVHLGVDGFQGWVDDALPELESRYADEVVLIDALDRIDPLPYEGDGHDHAHDAPDRDPSIAARAVTLIDLELDDTVADAHGDHWHGDPIRVPRGDGRSLRIVVETDVGEEVDLDDRYELAVRVDGDPSIVDVEATGGDRLDLVGRGDGFLRLAFQLLDAGDVAYETPPLETVVGNHSHDVDDHEHGAAVDHAGDGHDHSHGEYDAKFFSDPLLARRGVETIRDGLIDLDPRNESVYRENAAAYVEDLEALHRSFEERLADREHDAVVLAGHDSFRYLSDRYGFEVHTPVGLSPDAEVASDALAETVAFVEARGIEYVLYDHFDGDRQAELIADAADTVEGTLMVSPAESTTEAWLDAGSGGYLGQMREFNLPAFEKALGAE